MTAVNLTDLLALVEMLSERVTQLEEAEGRRQNAQRREELAARDVESMRRIADRAAKKEGT